MRLLVDEQIFVVQEHGGISRLFAELAGEFLAHPELNVGLSRWGTTSVNHYLLDKPELRQVLDVRPARNIAGPLLRYFTAPRRRADIDLVHCTFYLTRGLRDYPGVPKVVTIHDMIPELMPETRRRLDWITHKRRYVDQAQHIICVSESTKHDMLQIYGDVQAPITVIPHGVSPAFTPVAERLSELEHPYLLFVGNRDGYKDAAVLLEAFARLRGEFPDLHILFVGGGPWSRAEQRAFQRLSISDAVHQRTLPESLMPAAYSGAVACIFPSRYEGFGLPALEAMACGTPLILADASALPEVGGSAARYFVAGDAISLEEAIRAVLSDAVLRAQMSERGLQRAAMFPWERTAQATVATYDSVLATF